MFGNSKSPAFRERIELRLYSGRVVSINQRRRFLIVANRTHPNLRHFSLPLINSGKYEVAILVKKCSKDFVGHQTTVVYCEECDTLEGIEKQTFDLVVFRNYDETLCKIARSKLADKAVQIQYDQSPNSRGFWLPLGVAYYLYRLLRGRPGARMTPHGKPKSQTLIMRLIGEQHFIHPSPPENTLSHSARRENLELGTVAKRYVKRKRVDLLLRALERAGFSGHLKIFMSDHSWTNRRAPSKSEIVYDKRLADIAKKAAFEVSFRRNLDQQEMLTQLQLVDLFVLPSVNEPFSTSHLEALSLGVPVVITRSNGARGHVLQGVNGFVVGKSEKALASTLRPLFDNPSELESLKTSTRVFLEQEGLHSNLVEVIDNFYERKRS